MNFKKAVASMIVGLSVGLCGCNEVGAEPSYYITPEDVEAQIAAQQKAKAAAAAAKVRQAKENERLADKARDQGYEDELRALAIEEKRMELAHKKAMLEAQSKAADKYVEQDLNVRKAATDVIQSQADANRNITKGIQNNLESQGKAEEKRAGNWFNR